MPCKYTLVIKIGLDKCHSVFTFTKDLLYLSPLKKKKVLTVFLSTLCYIDFVLLLIMMLDYFP